MMQMKDLEASRRRRHIRIRKRISGTARRPRLSVFRSLGHIYAQILDDTLGQTITSASTLDPEIRAETQPKAKTEKAKLVGTLLGKRALDKGIEQVVFDRGGYKYHGRIKILADAAREVGLKF